MSCPTLFAAHAIPGERPDYTRATAEDDYYAQNQGMALTLRMPAISLARLRFAISAFRSAYMSYGLAR